MHARAMTRHDASDETQRIKQMEAEISMLRFKLGEISKVTGNLTADIGKCWANAKTKQDTLEFFNMLDRVLTIQALVIE